MGSCSPKLELPSGKSCSVEFDITNTSKPIMSVGKGVCRGFSYQFTPEGSWIEKDGHTEEM
eukprot:9674987-Alexandrium_andersonii.AAC.1